MYRGRDKKDMLKVKNYFENINISELPTYFIADIAANHDGSISKAKELIHRLLKMELMF